MGRGCKKIKKCRARLCGSDSFANQTGFACGPPFRIRRKIGEEFGAPCGRGAAGFACGRVPFRSCEKEPKARLGRKRGFDFECEGRILAHSVFPLRTPRFTGAQGTGAAFYFRRGVSRHAKPLIIAAAPMELVKVCWAIGGRLRCMLAYGCGGANERISRKSTPAAAPAGASPENR